MQIWVMQGTKKRSWKKDAVPSALGEKPIVTLLDEIVQDKRRRGVLHLVFSQEEEMTLAQASQSLFDVDAQSRAELMLKAAVTLYGLRSTQTMYTTIVKEEPEQARLAILIDKSKV